MEFLIRSDIGKGKKKYMTTTYIKYALVFLLLFPGVTLGQETSKSNRTRRNRTRTLTVTQLEEVYVPLEITHSPLLVEPKFVTDDVFWIEFRIQRIVNTTTFLPPKQVWSQRPCNGTSSTNHPPICIRSFRTEEECPRGIVALLARRLDTVVNVSVLNGGSVLRIAVGPMKEYEYLNSEIFGIGIDSIAVFNNFEAGAKRYRAMPNTPLFFNFTVFRSKTDLEWALNVVISINAVFAMMLSALEPTLVSGRVYAQLLSFNLVDCRSEAVLDLPWVLHPMMISMFYNTPRFDNLLSSLCTNIFLIFLIHIFYFMYDCAANQTRVAIRAHGRKYPGWALILVEYLFPSITMISCRVALHSNSTSLIVLGACLLFFCLVIICLYTVGAHHGSFCLDDCYERGLYVMYGNFVRGAKWFCVVDISWQFCFGLAIAPLATTTTECSIQYVVLAYLYILHGVLVFWSKPVHDPYEFFAVLLFDLAGALTCLSGTRGLFLVTIIMTSTAVLMCFFLVLRALPRSYQAYIRQSEQQVVQDVAEMKHFAHTVFTLSRATKGGESSSIAVPELPIKQDMPSPKASPKSILLTENCESSPIAPVMRQTTKAVIAPPRFPRPSIPRKPQDLCMDTDLL